MTAIVQRKEELWLSPVLNQVVPGLLWLKAGVRRTITNFVRCHLVRYRDVRVRVTSVVGVTSITNDGVNTATRATSREQSKRTVFAATRLILRTPCGKRMGGDDAVNARRFARTATEPPNPALAAFHLQRNKNVNGFGNVQESVFTVLRRKPTRLFWTNKMVCARSAKKSVEQGALSPSTTITEQAVSGDCFARVVIMDLGDSRMIQGCFTKQPSIYAAVTKEE